jgi:hypothetical protein
VGNQRVTVRTLPDGSKVNHYPPDERHPQGKMVLIHDHSPLKARHDAMLADKKRRHKVLKAVHTTRIAFKKAKQKANGWPAEKSPI